MNLLNKKDPIDEPPLSGLGSKTLSSDAQEILLAEARQVEITKRLDEKHEHKLRLEKEIELAREYVTIGLWHGALQVLKKLSLARGLTTEQNAEVAQLFTEAEQEMAQAELTHPDKVHLYKQFNLPIDNVT